MRPALPDWSALSIKRAIFLALLVIAIGWWSMRLATRENVYQYREALRQKAADAYFDGHAARAARLYDEILQYSDTIKVQIVHLREQAASYGKSGQYGKQLRNHLRARRLAMRHGLDSLRKISNRSIGNIYAACRKNVKFCKGIEGRSFLSRWRAERPLILLVVALFLFGVYMLLDD